MSERNRYRDEELGVALRQLEVPEHRAGFFRELEHLLAQHESPRGRKPIRKRLRVGLGLGLAALAAVAAIVVVAVGLPGTGGGPSVARAAEVQARVAAAIAHVKTVAGELVLRQVDESGKLETLRWTFALTADGDFRLRQLGAPSDLAYDPARGVERAITTSASMGEGVFYAKRSGVAPGPPDAGPSDFVLDRDLGAAVRALLAAHDPRVEEIRYQGREAWLLDVPVRPNAVFADADRLEITVDRESGLPVRVVSTLHDEFRSELRLEQMLVNGSLPNDTFTVRFPAGAEVLETTEGFRRVELGAVAGLVGYEPVVPARLPKGFELSAVAVAKRAAPTGPGQANPQSRMVVSLAYRRGFDRLIVTTRLRGAQASRWQDPLATEGLRTRSERLTLSAGALAGARAEIVVDPRTLPHLWAVNDRLVVTIAGNLSRAELLDAAESLR